MNFSLEPMHLLIDKSAVHVVESKEKTQIPFHLICTVVVSIDQDLFYK